MGTSLVGLLPQNTYVGLIKVGNNTALNATLKTLSDGAGNDLPMQASTTAINFTGTTTGLTSGVAGAIQFSNGSAFASDAANLFWDNTNKRLGILTNAPTRTITSQGIIGLNDSTGAEQMYILPSTTGVDMRAGNGFRFDVRGGVGTTTSYLMTSLFGVGTMSPLARTHIVGSGSTSATTSLLVQNSSSLDILKATDDQRLYIGNSGSSNGGAILFQFPQVGTNGVFWGDNYSSVYGSITLSRSTGEMRFDANTGGYFQTFRTGGVERMRITDSGNIGIGTSSPNASALVQINSTTRGFLPPVMTTTQKNAIASPLAGLVVYDSTAKSPGYYDGTNWGYTGGALQNTTGNGGTLNVSFAAGNIVNLTLNATTTLAFANSVIGTYIIQVTQSAGGGSSLVYPASVKWSGGTAPTLSTAVGKTDILTFYYDGTNYYGNYSLNY